MENKESSMRERLDEYWNEHDGTHFYKDELLSFIQSEIDLVKKEEREETIVEISKWRELKDNK